jgi:1-deoxypentalenic acid 11beta-hydroxylase
MQLSELRDSNDLLDDPGALEARFEQDGCLFIRGALDPVWLAAVTDAAALVLERCGVARRQDGLRWTGVPMPHIDEIGLNDSPALSDLVIQVDQGSMPMATAASRACGHPMQVWRMPYFAVCVPDDPAYVTAPHQDNFALPGQDRRRLWFPLTEIPFGDGGLAVALGSHRRGLLPFHKLDAFKDRATGGQLVAPHASGVDAELVDDHWHTASMAPGDLLTFHPHIVHRGLPGASDRVRVALASIASAGSAPLPPTGAAVVEQRARQKRIRQLAAPLGLNDAELFRLAMDLSRAGIEPTEESVRAAARGDYAPA